MIAAAGHGDPVAPTPPPPDGALHIQEISFFRDGGTVGVRASDPQGGILEACFDGRPQLAESSYPRHVFLGGQHPSRPDARPLPLWGPEERALIDRLHAALCDSLAPDQRRLLQRARGVGEIGAFSTEIWHLVRAVEGRRRVHEALDHGHLMHAEDVIAWFDLAPPVSLVSVEQDAAGVATVVVQDAADNRIFAEIPVASPVDRSRVSTADYDHTFALGTWPDRYLTTLVALAVREPGTSPSIAPLRDALARRRQLILSADSTR
jgi:hypothetical protein